MLPPRILNVTVVLAHTRTIEATSLNNNTYLAGKPVTAQTAFSGSGIEGKHTCIKSIVLEHRLKSHE